MIHFSLHWSRFPSAETDRLREGIRRRVLPASFLYDSPAQSGRYLAYHRAFSPSVIDGEVEAMYDAASRSATDRIRAERFLHVSLGCGSGQKDRRISSHTRGRASYMPVDTSSTLVAESVLANRDVAASIDPWVMDLDADVSANDFGPAGTPRLFTAFGMVPNFDLERFGPRLSQWMRRDDRLLISFNLSPGRYDEAAPRIVSQYDNEPGRAWMWGALREIGLSRDDTELRIEGAEEARDGRVWRVEAWADIRRDVELPLPWGREAVAEGESLRVLISNRLTAEAAEAHLHAWGLDVETRWVSSSNEEGIWLCRRPHAAE